MPKQQMMTIRCLGQTANRKSNIAKEGEDMGKEIVVPGIRRNKFVP